MKTHFLLRLSPEPLLSGLGEGAVASGNFFVRLMKSLPPSPGVAVRGQHGGPALLTGGPHRAEEEAIQQQHRLLHQEECSPGCRGLDGRLQVSRVHSVESATGGRTKEPFPITLDH